MVRRSVLYLAISVLLWLAGVAAALDDVDFFNVSDFQDRTELHHEHLVVLAGVVGLLFLLAAVVRYLKELRVHPPDWPDLDSKERV